MIDKIKDSGIIFYFAKEIKELNKIPTEIKFGLNILYLLFSLLDSMSNNKVLSLCHVGNINTQNNFFLD